MKLSFVWGMMMLLLSMATLTVRGQLDASGNPVFNSKVVSETAYDGFELTSSYYTIADNINDPSSSAYITRLPSQEEYLIFARDLPSYHWILHQGQEAIMLMMLIQKNDGGKTSLFYNVMNPATGASTQIPCSVWGEVSEKRARELLDLKVDSTARFIHLYSAALFCQILPSRRKLVNVR